MIFQDFKMKHAHYVNLRIFSYESDDIELIKNKVIEMFPYVDEKEKVKPKSKKQIVTDGKVIRVISLEVKKIKLLNKFLKQLFSKISNGDKKVLLDQLESRLDEGLHFYIRLNKDKFLVDKYELTDAGNCLHIKIAIAAYPNKREVAVEILKQIITQ